METLNTVLRSVLLGICLIAIIRAEDFRERGAWIVAFLGWLAALISSLVLSVK